MWTRDLKFKNGNNKTLYKETAGGMAVIYCCIYLHH